MHVKGVFAGRQSLERKGKAHASARLRERDGADILAVGRLEFGIRRCRRGRARPGLGVLGDFIARWTGARCTLVVDSGLWRDRSLRRLIRKRRRARKHKSRCSNCSKMIHGAPFQKPRSREVDTVAETAWSVNRELFLCRVLA